MRNSKNNDKTPALAAQGFSCAVKFPHIGIAALGMRWYNSCNRQSQDRYAALRQAAPDTVITDGGKQMKRIYRLGLGLLCAGLLAAGIPQAAAAHWADQSIDFVQEQQWIDPVSPQDFAPDAPVSRAAVVTALYRMNGAAWEQGGTVPGFADVAAEDCCADAVYWAAAHGVVNGVSETAFRPGDGITREQLAAVLQRFANVRQRSRRAQVQRCLPIGHRSGPTRSKAWIGLCGPGCWKAAQAEGLRRRTAVPVQSCL